MSNNANMEEDREHQVDRGYESEEVLLRVEEMRTKLRETIKMRKTRWIGHVLRRTDERCA